jgi:2-dehydropantoate 2-reductase
MRICIAGAGAIGGILAARLAAAGHTVSMLARGKTLAALLADGLTLNDLQGRTHVRVAASDRAEFGVQDVIFLCTKTQDLPDLLPQLVPLIGADTVVVPTNNGVPWWYFHREGGAFDGELVRAVDPDGKMSSWVPNDQLLGSVMFITGEVISAGVIVAGNPHLIILGEPSGAMTPRLERIRAVLEGAGIEARASDRIRDSVWTKITANISSNPLSVVTQTTLEQLYGQPDLREVAGQIIAETLQVAAAYGAKVVIDQAKFLELGQAMGPVRTSMLQDFERGRTLELAAIGDAVLELAQRFELPMRVTRTVLSLARFRGAH